MASSFTTTNVSQRFSSKERPARPEWARAGFVCGQAFATQPIIASQEAPLNPMMGPLASCLESRTWIAAGWWQASTHCPPPSLLYDDLNHRPLG